MLLTRNWKPTANEGFAIIDLNKRDEAVVWCLRLVETNTLGDVDYHKGATLLIRHVLWGCMKVETVVKHTLTGRKLHWHSETGVTLLHLCASGLEGRIFCQRF